MKLFPPLAILLFAVSVFAQGILKNQDVIELTKSGLSTEIIAAKIRASETDFDTSTEALKALSDAKVPDAIVVVMLEKEQKRRDEAKREKQESSESIDSIPEQGSLADIVDAKRVYIFTDNTKLRDIITKELSKANRFQIVERIEDSDFAIKFQIWTEDLGAIGSVYGNTANVNRKVQTVGLLNVIMPSKESRRLRLVYTVRKSKYFIWEDNPAESTARQFVKDLAKATSK